MMTGGVVIFEMIALAVVGVALKFMVSPRTNGKARATYYEPGPEMLKSLERLDSPMGGSSPSLGGLPPSLGGLDLSAGDVSREDEGQTPLVE